MRYLKKKANFQNTIIVFNILSWIFFSANIIVMLILPFLVQKRAVNPMWTMYMYYIEPTTAGILIVCGIFLTAMAMVFSMLGHPNRIAGFIVVLVISIIAFLIGTLIIVSYASRASSVGHSELFGIEYNFHN